MTILYLCHNAVLRIKWGSEGNAPGRVASQVKQTDKNTKSYYYVKAEAFKVIAFKQ